MKNTILFLLVVSTQALAAGPMAAVSYTDQESVNTFDLSNMPGSKDQSGAICNPNLDDLTKSIKELADIPRNDKFWAAQTKNGDLYIKITATEKPKKEDIMAPLGLTVKDALLASRDAKSDSVFSSGHDQGDVANRWGHTVIYRIPAEVARNMGASQILTSVLGFIAALPKEYLYDLHPSASDIPITYGDRLGTKSSSFEFTVFGDTFYNHRPFEGKVEMFKGSSPFVTWRRKF